MKQDNKEALLFFIDGKQFETIEQYLTGAALKKLAGVPEDIRLYLAVQEGYEPELIENHKEVDLARRDVEHFFVKDKLKFTINGAPFISYEQYIKGSQIRKLGNIPADDDIFLTNVPPYKDDLIKDDEKVDLARPGREHFISKEKPFEVTISVNGRDKQWKEKTISYEQVVAIAREGKPVQGPVKYYLVTYFDGPPQNPKGELAKGASVFVTNHMMFNAAPSDKS